MKLKKEHIAFLNDTARIDFDRAMQVVDGVNMLSEVEYGFVQYSRMALMKCRRILKLCRSERIRRRNVWKRQLYH